ncbi:MAG: ABC transporter permease [Ilumatobacteraceae bacterium]
MSTSWGAVGAVARHEVRRRGAALVLLGLAAGILGAVVLGALTTARRTATAYERLEQASAIDDVRAQVFGDPAFAVDVAGLPGVTSSWTAAMAVGRVEGPGTVYSALLTGPPPPAGLFTPVVVAGRMPAADAPEEVLVVEAYADDFDLAPGDTMTLEFLTPDEVAQFDTGFGDPDGPTVELVVSGITRLPGARQSPIVAGPAFFARYGDDVTVGHTVLLRLGGGRAAVPTLQREVDAMLAGVPVAPGAEEFVPVQLSSPTAEQSTYSATARVLVAGQVVLAVGVALAGLMAVGQAFGRHHAARAGDQRVESALGMTTTERVLARLLAAAPAVIVAAGVATVGGLAAGALEPLGALRGVEPHPGWAPNVAVVVAGGLAVGLAVAVLASSSAWRAGRARTPERATAAVVTGLVGRAPGPVGTAGMGLALVPGGDPAPVPLRSSAAGAVLGIAGVVAVAVFGAGLARLVDTPERWGWSADVSVVDATPEIADSLLADPAVAAVSMLDAATVRIDGTLVNGYASAPVAGDVLTWTVVDGRLPTADDEVVLGTRLADRLGRGIGDTVTIGDEDAATMTVVGIGLGPSSSGEALGTTALVTPARLAASGETAAFREALVRAAPGADVDALVSSLQHYELTVRVPPPEVANLDSLGRLPLALAAVLGLVALAGLVHALTSTVRRRARELAVLRAVGFTPGQVAGSVTVTALTTAAVGVLLGVPLGLGVGRLVWWVVAAASGVATDAAVPVRLLVLIAVGVPVVAVMAALVPARRAALLRPAAILAAE